MVKYFDVVVDENYVPLFHGPAEKTVKWLKEHRELSCFVRVVLDVTLDSMTVERYLEHRENRNLRPSHE